MEEINYVDIYEPYGFIYITTNLVNGKRYLGQRKFSDGWKNYLGSGLAFKDAINKYGEENFKRNIVAICSSEDELNQVEYDLSVFFDVVNSPDWYNLVLGGGTSRGWHPSENTKKKISEAAKERFKNPENHPMYGNHMFSGENNPMYGISPKERMDEDTYNKWYESHRKFWSLECNKNKVSEFFTEYWKTHDPPNLGKKMSDKTKSILSNKALERYKNKENHPMYGKHHTEEEKKQMSEFRSSKDWWKCERIYCIELNEIFFSAKNAYNKYGFDSSGIIKCCRGKRKSTGKHPINGNPLHWLYAKDAIEQCYITQEDLDNYLNELNKEN